MRFDHMRREIRDLRIQYIVHPDAVASILSSLLEEIETLREEVKTLKENNGSSND